MFMEQTVSGMRGMPLLTATHARAWHGVLGAQSTSLVHGSSLMTGARNRHAKIGASGAAELDVAGVGFECGGAVLSCVSLPFGGVFVSMGSDDALQAGSASTSAKQNRRMEGQ